MPNALGGLVSVFQSARNEQRRREEAQRQADEEAQYRAEVERERQEERERQLAEERQEDAEQALDESCRLLIEAAAQTGGQVDLAGDNACSRPINAWLERNTRYSGGGRRSPTRPIDEPVIDGSQVPSLIDFTPSHALEELVESTAADSSTVPPNEDALDELLSSFFPADENPSSSTQAPEDPGSPVQIAEPAPEFETSTDSGEQSNGDGGDGASADDTPAGNPSALSILVGSATSTETIYDKVGEALASELYEDPVQRRLAELFAGAVGSTPNFKPVVDHAADLGAGMLLDKLDDLRHRAMTDPHAFDGIANGEQIRDLLWSMDPSNLRKGIYSYPSDMIDKLNTLFDSVGRGDGEEKQ
jgi:hypothetical protein